MGASLGDNGGDGMFSRQGAMAEINITPFVDVILVLLIIFMVAAPFAVSGVNVQLPATKAKPLQLGTDPIVLSVTQNGHFFLGKAEVGQRDLVEKLKAAKGSEKDPSVYIRADRGVPYGRVMEAMAAAQRAGIYRIGMLGDGSAKDSK